jgi:hypothetical protein
VVDLPGNDFARPQKVLVPELEDSQKVDSAADWCQRVSQLVGEHCQKLVLATVVFLDVAVEPRVLNGDGGAGCEVFCQRQVIWAKGRTGQTAGDGQCPQGLAAYLERNREHRATPEVARSTGPGESDGFRGIRGDARGGVVAELGDLGEELGGPALEHALEDGGQRVDWLIGPSRQLLARLIGRIDPGELGLDAEIARIGRQGQRAQVAQERDCLADEPTRDSVLIERLHEHPAGLGEEPGTSVCVFSGGARGLRPHERDVLFGLPPDLERFFEKVDEDAHLGSKDFRDDG